jgi:hypothetical protein
MQGDEPVSWLMFFTFAATIFIIAGAFIYHLRSQRNRDIAAEALAGDGSGHAPISNGALPDLLGIFVFALIAMGLLGFGYKHKSTYETAQAQPSATVGKSMAQPVGLAEQPKVYQPANPAPDTRSAPTSSDTGAGPANGGNLDKH